MGTSPKRAAGPKTILLVDDDSTVVKALEEVLRRQGYEVLPAENLEDAMTAARRVAGIDLLVVDAVMPQLSGPELAEILLFIRPKMKILFITGLDGLTMRLAFDRPCASLQKPFPVGLLVSTVQDLLKEDAGVENVANCG
jgi:two-component system, cell cycle sensor histidine kinase and response regulator CckA